MRSTDSRCVLASLALLALLLGCKDEVVVVVEVATVEVQGPALLVAGQTAQFTAIPRDDQGNRLTNRSISWTTSSGSLASVSSSGLVTGVLGGVVAVSANCEGKGGSAELQVNNPVPVVTSTEPDLVTMGGGAFELKVLGSGFVTTSLVRWNGTDRVTTYVSGTELRAALTAADVVGAGIFEVTVFNPAPGGGVSGNRPFTVGNPVPTLVWIFPVSSVMGTGPAILSIHGSDFVPGAIVSWAGDERIATFVSSTELRLSLSAEDLAAPGRRSVTVTNPSPGGGTTQAESYPVRIPGVGPLAGAADYQSCALGRSGVAYCWGHNGRGQLGDGTAQNRAEPVAVTGSPRLVAVDEGSGSGCGLDEVGGAWCWGANEFGQLGDGSLDDRAEAGPVLGDVALVTLSVGGSHACGITWEGDAVCWGKNDMGQLGDGSLVNQTAPTTVDQGALVFGTVSSGSMHSCAVTDGGQVYCWGRNDEGQLGDGSTNRRSTPGLVPGLTDISGVTAGTYHTCAWRDSGPAYCWGRGVEGQLGDGSFTTRLNPAQVSSVADFVALSASPIHTCGIDSGGEVHCWGNGHSGQLGTGTRVSHGQPVPVPGLPRAIAIATGGYHSCAVTSSSEAYCWGAMRYGQLGHGDTSVRTTPVPVSGGPAAFAEVTTGVGFACGRSPLGTAYCWGGGWNGRRGDGSQTDAASPVQVNTGQLFATVSTGNEHACGLTALGQAYCWGRNGYGQLGNGSTTDAYSPAAVAGGHTFKSIGAGGNHTCAVDGAGSVYCWGRNDSGQLGDGSTTDQSLPIFVPTGVVGRTFQTVATGYAHTCATTPWGSAFCWGANPFGQLGDGTNQDRTTQVQVPGLAGVTQVSLGGNHTCALLDAGDAYCWGYANYGQLGIGSTVNRNSPVLVEGGHAFRSIHASDHHTCAVTAGNQGYCWGENTVGQLGDGTFTWRITPTQVAGGLSWAMIGSEGGPSHTCGVTTGGAAMCWGFQEFGELGIGSLGVELEPVLVAGGISFGPPLHDLGAPPGKIGRGPDGSGALLRR